MRDDRVDVRYEPRDKEPAYRVPNVVAMEENSPESHVDDPDSKCELAAWNFVKDERLIQEQVQSKDAGLGCVTTGPRAVDLLSSDIKNAFRDIFNAGSRSFEMFLQHHTGDESSHRLSEVLRAIVYEVV